MKMEKMIRILAKTCIIFFVIIVGYWGNYFYGEYQYKQKRKQLFKEYNLRPIDSTTRGGYAHPSRDSIPNTLRPDTL